MKPSNLRKSTPLCLLIKDVFTNYEDTRLIKRNVRIQACIKNKAEEPQNFYHSIEVKEHVLSCVP